jgi:hypothetical protein
MMAVGGGGAPVTSDLRRGAWEVQREVRKVVRWFVWAEGGWRPRMAVAALSSAMAAMATQLRAAALWLRARRPRHAHGREKGLAKTLAHAAAAVAA